MCADDPDKIPFHFYLIEEKHANAFALANGTVDIHSAMFDVLENGGELASVLGHEMAHAVEEHTRREMEYHQKKLLALTIGATIAAGFGHSNIANTIVAAVRNGYSRSLENQADRVGLEYIVEAGYDPREAARVWKVLSKKYGDAPTDLFWSSHDNDTTRRSYIMAELRMNFSGLDSGQLKTNSDDFPKIAALVHETESAKKKRNR